jgi:putative spermidine/putrescine transport system permease protein
MADGLVRNRQERSGYITGALLILPAALLVAAVVVAPLIVIGPEAFRIDGVWTLENFRAILHDAPYLKLFWNTIEISFEVTLLCILLATPLALISSRAGGRVTTVIIAGVAASFWISILVRTYGWFVLLGVSGPVYRASDFLHVGPIELLYTRPGTLIAMTNVMLPYAALPLVAYAVRAVDWTLADAASSLGAGTIRTYGRVILPQLLPGMAAAGVLTFIVSLGFFVTPQLLGSPSDTMISQAIYGELNRLYDPSRASALSLGLLLLVASVPAIFWSLRTIMRAGKRMPGRSTATRRQVATEASP